MDHSTNSQIPNSHQDLEKPYDNESSPESAVVDTLTSASMRRGPFKPSGGSRGIGMDPKELEDEEETTEKASDEFYEDDYVDEPYEDDFYGMD